MPTSLFLDIPWGRLHPGATVARSDGSVERVNRVDAHERTVTVQFPDGDREQHDQSETARILVRRCALDDDGETEHNSSMYDLVAGFLLARDPQQIEWGADRLGASADPRAIPVLLARLGDVAIRDDPDVEDAVCSALVALGVMEREGNLVFALRSIETLPPREREAFVACDPSTIPRRYRRG